MSLESRYDAIVKDMITLLQEALVRYISNKQVDLSKLKHYFSQFYKGMTALEESFHQKSTKFSKNLSKMSQIFLKAELNSKFSLEPTTSQLLKPSLMTVKHSVTPIQASLKIIGEEEQDMDDRKRQRRSETAEGRRRRPQNFIIDFSQGKYRPKTGVSRGHKPRRYEQFSAGINSQTINHEIGTSLNNFETLNSRDLDENINHAHQERKSFYQQLQKEKGKDQSYFDNIIKIPAKKKTMSNHRWSFKINKLF